MTDPKTPDDYYGEANIAMTLLMAELYDIVSKLPGASPSDIRNRLFRVRTMAARYGDFAAEVVDTVAAHSVGAPEENPNG